MERKSANKYKFKNNFRHFNATQISMTVQQQTSENISPSLLSILPSAIGINPIDEQQQPKLKKKKRRPKLS